MTETEKRVLAAIQHGMGATRNPYADTAKRAGLTTEQVLEVLRRWKQNGKLRRVGAVVNHLKAGYETGLMVLWQVPEERVEHVGRILSSFAEVSHAYERPARPGWPYNVYTMVHGQTRRGVDETVERMVLACGVTEYRKLATVKELKKVPPTYITGSSLE